MPIFFFHVHGEGGRLDGEGRNFPDARAALNWARRLLFEALLHRPASLKQCIEIADAQGVPIARVPFGDAAAGNVRAFAKTATGI